MVDFINTVEGREYAPFYYQSCVAHARQEIHNAIASLAESSERFKGISVVKRDDGDTDLWIYFKDGIGFCVSVQLDHAPTITD